LSSSALMSINMGTGSWLTLSLSLLFVLFVNFVLSEISGPSDTFSVTDAANLQKIIFSAQMENGLFNGKLADTYFAIDTLNELDALNKLLKKEKICEAAKKELKSQNLATLYYAVHILDLLDCGEKATPEVVKIITATATGNTLLNYYQTVKIFAVLKAKNHIDLDWKAVVPLVDKLLELQDEEEGTFRLTEDSKEGSPYFAGLALEALSILYPHAGDQNKELIESLKEKITTLLASGTEQPESNSLVFKHQESSISNLKTTSKVIEGITHFVRIVNKGVLLEDITNEQVTGITEYLISHKFTNNIEEANALIRGLKACNSPYVVRPLVLTLPEAVVTSSAKRDTNVKVRVSDVFGRATAKEHKVTLIRAYTLGSDKTPLLTKIELTRLSDDPSIYSFNFLGAKPEPGTYVLEFRVISQERTFQNIDLVKRRLKVVTKVSVPHITMSVSDTPDPTDDMEVRSFTIEFDKKLNEVVKVDQHQHIFVTFKIFNAVTNRLLTVRQAFLKLTHITNNDFINFIVRPENKVYKVHLSAQQLATLFNNHSGEYALELIVGDHHIENSFVWNLGRLQLTFAGTPSKQPSDYEEKLPEIRHIFAQPEKRAPRLVSTTFTILCLVPLVFLVIGFLLAGANCADCPKGTAALFALGFHIIIGAIFCLLVWYWVELTIFQTAAALLIISPAAVFTGVRTLRTIAERRIKLKPE
jgi:hypothetical protein